jgi:hypothetical protein
VFDSHRLENTLIHVPHITAEHQARRYTEPTSFSDPEKAARKLIEIANAAESVQDQRVHIELIPRPFLHAGGSPDEYRVNRRGVPTPIEHAKLLIHLAMEGSLLDAY